jgi:sugar lactone lactonase YvrE
MYYIDTPTLEVSAFDYDIETGTISNRRAAATIPEGYGRPDGMAIDVEGMLWVAVWGSGEVSRWDPRSGEMLQTISVPATNVTACAFGGPDLDQLYITTARIRLDEQALAEQPYAGGLFKAWPGVRGVETYEFAG